MSGEDQPMTTYPTDWKSTDWDGVTTRDDLDTASGMDPDDTAGSRMQPDSIARPLYSLELKYPNPDTGKVELMPDKFADQHKRGG